MTAMTATYRRLCGRFATVAAGRTRERAVPAATPAGDAVPVDIAPDDSLFGYLPSANGVVEIEALEQRPPPETGEYDERTT